MSEPGDLTTLLQAWADGEPGARDAAIERAYAELRKIAQNRLRTEGDHQTLDATGLAHEAFMRLAAQTQVRWENRSQFFAIAATVMRRILVDRHRARHARKRAGGGIRVELSDVGLASADRLDLEQLEQALERLAVQDPRQAQIVELRFFAGLTIEDTAGVVGVSPATLKREWAMARAWLKRELDGA